MKNLLLIAALSLPFCSAQAQLDPDVKLCILGLSLDSDPTPPKPPSPAEMEKELVRLQERERILGLMLKTDTKLGKAVQAYCRAYVDGAAEAK